MSKENAFRSLRWLFKERQHMKSMAANSLSRDEAATDAALASRT